MIQIIDNPILLYQILDLAKEIPDTPIDVLEKMLTDGIGSPDARIMIDKKDDKIRGFMFSSIERFQGQDSVFIQSSYVSPNSPHIAHGLLQETAKWGKSRGIEKMLMITQRNPKAVERRFKFKLLSYVMEKKI